MAGIGFELRKFLQKDSFLGFFQAYGYAGIINSGPWVLSILGVVSIGILSISLNTDVRLVTAFLISVTYLIACSIILGGWLQLMFTRFVSDLLFADQKEDVLPNLMGALLITTMTSLLVSSLFWPLFIDTSLGYRLIMLSNLMVLSNIWILVVMLSGLRSYKLILGTFFVGYSLSILVALLLRNYGVEGLLAGFCIGQSVMMYLMLALLVREYPSDRLLDFSFLHKKKAFYSLAATSIIYNFGIWADKIIFWFNPLTSEAIIGPIRSSSTYDPPIFIAYLAIIPGMAAFLLRMEADFVDDYDAFFNAIKKGESLTTIQRLKKDMITTIETSILEVFKIQLITAITLIYTADQILVYFGFSDIYWTLFVVYVIAVSIQVLLLAINNILYYLDKRKMTLLLAILFAVSNIIFTTISQYFGSLFYGVGYASSILLTLIVGVYLVYQTLNKLEYETFMLQR
ncbi:MAG: exopolysaccharide Pel transporter PelG [Methylococcales bacterium]|nr:exopolysaccharide Pel transporter PelG [Methylococcales bacterium]